MPTPASSTIADMLLLGFYLLLWPSEYGAMDNVDASPFCYCDMHFLIHDRHLNHFTWPDAELQWATYIALEFTNQKNGLRGEMVGVGWSGHSVWFQVMALINCIQHLWQHHAPPHTPLFSTTTNLVQDWYRYLNTTFMTNHSSNGTDLWHCHQGNLNLCSIFTCIWHHESPLCMNWHWHDLPHG
jgi:hypothetical protein